MTSSGISPCKNKRPTGVGHWCLEICAISGCLMSDWVSLSGSRAQWAGGWAVEEVDGSTSRVQLSMNEWMNAQGKVWSFGPSGSVSPVPGQDCGLRLNKQMMCNSFIKDLNVEVHISYLTHTQINGCIFNKLKQIHLLKKVCLYDMKCWH